MQGCDPAMNAPRFRLLRPDGEARDARLSRTEATLQATARQQEAVAHLGQQALAGAPVRDLMDAAVGLAARVLEVEFGSVLEFRPESRTLVLRAGVGWGDGSPVIIPADADSHAGYTLRAAGPVVVEELATDARFATAPLLASHGVVSSLSVLIHGKDRPFGILGTHSARRREFAIHDTHFLQAVANVLATAIDRAATEQALRHSEEHFRSLIENASDIVTIVGDNGVFRYASPSVERVLGYGPAELLERSAFDLVHPEDIALVAEALARALQQPHSPQLAEFRFRHQDGSWRVLEAVGQARVDRGRAARAGWGDVLLDRGGVRDGVRGVVLADTGWRRRPGQWGDRRRDGRHRPAPRRGRVAAVRGEQPCARRERELRDLPVDPRGAVPRGQLCLREAAGVRVRSRVAQGRRGARRLRRSHGA